jgi:signal transduction histidine kinase
MDDHSATRAVAERERPSVTGETESYPEGLALLCDKQGEIIEVVCNGMGIDRASAGRHLITVVDEGSVEKARNFLARLQEKGAIFDWELNVPFETKLTTLRFAGMAMDERLWILAAKTDCGLTELCEELTRISNEQANALRAAVKKNVGFSCAGDKPDDLLYDKMSSLNNELVAMQRELTRKNAELERLNEQKNQFLGMAAHDLRNPLHAILSYSDFLLEDAGDVLSEEEIEFLSIIQSSTKFMAALVNDLLDVAKIESGKLDLSMRPTDLSALVEDNVALNRPLARNKHIELALSVEELPSIRVDPRKIEQVLNNLISNAMKYSPSGTTVDVRLYQADGQALFEVEDRGEGIPEGERDTLFKPFGTTSVRGTAGEKSTGLGLVIVKRIVEGHGGEINVESELGEGSTFTVLLPLESEKEREN